MRECRAVIAACYVRAGLFGAECDVPGCGSVRGTGLRFGKMYFGVMTMDAKLERIQKSLGHQSYADIEMRDAECSSEPTSRLCFHTRTVFCEESRASRRPPSVRCPRGACACETLTDAPSPRAPFVFRPQLSPTVARSSLPSARCTASRCCSSSTERRAGVQSAPLPDGRTSAATSARSAPPPSSAPPVFWTYPQTCVRGAALERVRKTAARRAPFALPPSVTKSH